MIRALRLGGSDRISPTAHYTGYVWVRNGLSHPALATGAGRLFCHALAPANATSARLGQPHLEHYLLARHTVIDHLLTEAIEQGRVAQVVEVAAGLSGRGLRFTQRFGDAITYIEADLPGMAERKRRMLRATGEQAATHCVEDVDAMRDSGPGSLADLASNLDPAKGLAIITEGLVNYFDQASVQTMWTRFASVLSGFSAGLYLSDIHLRGNQGRLDRAAVAALSAFVRGQVHLHFTGTQDAETALRKAGFAEATLRRPDAFAGTLPHCTGRSARANHIIEASVGG
ncbi:class I SAM-dependent methyltransferase [Haloechinothrix halophila]|uniref:class I SAM-dependent methyltransferase n=1 Tax=Haloechinothrix halophila TaxID=1069073 RepID=UPI0004037913|nr:class I SAM-dependent methyltransferase [Haloechinothrix halophila]